MWCGRDRAGRRGDARDAHPHHAQRTHQRIADRDLRCGHAGGPRLGWRRRRRRRRGAGASSGSDPEVFSHALRWRSSHLALRWSDGTAPTSFADHAGRCIFAPDSFYAFDVLATTKLRTLTLLFGAYQARGKLTVTLSDGTPAQTDASLDNKTESMATIQYVVTFSAAAATGVSLHVDWRDDSHRLNGSVYLGSAAVHE